MSTKKNQYMPLIYFTITLLASFMQGTVSADEWLPASTKNGVQTFLRSVEHSKYKAVRGEAGPLEVGPESDLLDAFSAGQVGWSTMKSVPTEVSIAPKASSPTRCRRGRSPPLSPPPG